MASPSTVVVMPASRIMAEHTRGGCLPLCFPPMHRTALQGMKSASFRLLSSSSASLQQDHITPATAVLASERPDCSLPCQSGHRHIRASVESPARRLLRCLPISLLASPFTIHKPALPLPPHSHYDHALIFVSITSHSSRRCATPISFPP